MDWYHIPVNPEPWAIGPVGTGRRNGKMWAYVGQNQQLHAYQEAVRESLFDPTTISIDSGPHKYYGSIHLVFYFWRQVTREDRAHEADVTNMQKATEDALQGILYDNDRSTRQITSVLVDQGPLVDGKVIVGIAPFQPREFPKPVEELLLKVKPIQEMSNNEWNGPDIF